MNASSFLRRSILAVNSGYIIWLAACIYRAFAADTHRHGDDKDFVLPDDGDAMEAYVLTQTAKIILVGVLGILGALQYNVVGTGAALGCYCFEAAAASNWILVLLSLCAALLHAFFIRHSVARSEDSLDEKSVSLCCPVVEQVEWL